MANKSEDTATQPDVPTHHEEIEDTSSLKQKFFFGARGKSLTRQISFAGAIGFMLFGYDQGVLGGLNAAEQFLEQFNYPSSGILGIINAIYEVGCFAGAVNVFFVGEKLGRKRCMYIGGGLMFIGAVLQATSYGLAQMLVGRVVCGWGNGFNTATTPLWVSELIPARSRGRHVSIAGNLIGFGIVIAYYLNIALAYTTGPVQWRFPIAAQCIFIIGQMLWIFFLPESPRWLAKHRKHAEAIEVLSQLFDAPKDHPSVLGQKSEIDQAVALEEVEGPWKFQELFKNGPLKVRRRFFLGAGLQAMTQLSGINVLVYYAPRLLTTTLGYSYIESLHFAAGMADTYWIFGFIPVFFLDRMGRRNPLIYGSIACGLCFLCVALLQKDTTVVKAKASLTFFFLFEAIFAVGFLPIPWLYAPEIMPLRHRTHSAAASAASNWIFNFLIVQITPIALSSIGWKTYLIFFILPMAWAVIIFLFYPETSGRTLESIDTMYLGDNDRLIVVDKMGRLLPAFSSQMNQDTAQTVSSALGQDKV